MLEIACSNFPGALVLVTHDRWLLDRVSLPSCWRWMVPADSNGSPTMPSGKARRNGPLNLKQAGNDDATAHAATDQGQDCDDSQTKKLSYREQKEWGIEGRFLKAEEQVATCQAAHAGSNGGVEYPGCGHGTHLVEAHRLKWSDSMRWAELDEKRAQTVQSS